MPTAFVHSRSSTARVGGEAMETFLNAFRDGYARVAGARERWDDAQKASTALLGAVVNAFERMPALERGATREDVLGNDEFGKRVVEAQYASLDRLFTRLREECDEFERLTRELEHAKTDAWMRTRNLTPPPKRAGGERSGPQPPVDIYLPAPQALPAGLARWPRASPAGPGRRPLTRPLSPPLPPPPCLCSRPPQCGLPQPCLSSWKGVLDTHLMTRN